MAAVATCTAAAAAAVIVDQAHSASCEVPSRVPGCSDVLGGPQPGLAARGDHSKVVALLTAAAVICLPYTIRNTETQEFRICALWDGGDVCVGVVGTWMIAPSTAPIKTSEPLEPAGRLLDGATSGEVEW